MDFVAFAAGVADTVVFAVGNAADVWFTAAVGTCVGAMVWFVAVVAGTVAATVVGTGVAARVGGAVAGTCVGCCVAGAGEADFVHPAVNVHRRRITINPVTRRENFLDGCLILFYLLSD